MARYVTTYSSRREHLLDASFHCQRCAFASPVQVKGSCSVAGRPTPQSSAHDAESGAFMDAAMKFDLLRCPRCNCRSAKGDDREKRAVGNVRIYLGVSAALVVLGWILFEASSPYSTLRSAAVWVLVAGVPATLVNGVRFLKSFSFPKSTNMHATFLAGPQGAAPQPPQPYPQPPYPQQQAYPQQPQQPYPQQPYPQQQQPYPQQPSYPQQQPYPQQHQQAQQGPPPGYPQQHQPQGPPPGYPGPGPQGRR